MRPADLVGGRRARGERRRALAPHFAPLASLALASVACLACGPERTLPTIVLVSLDTTRADHLSTYGYRRGTDPFLAELAHSSRVFENAVPSATWTLPSHVSMFSGLDPDEHGCWQRLEDAGADGIPTVSPETPLFTGVLREAGYHQLAAVGGPFTSHRYGLLRDFDEWLDPGERWELPARELNAWIFDALERRPPDRPLFLFVNYFDAHAPYGAPPDREYPFPEEPRELAVVPPLEGRDPAAPLAPETLRDAVDQYDRELLVQDEALGELFARLEAQGLLEHALVVVTADHGEMFGEQAGIFGHGCMPFEPVARVPLVVHRRPSGPVDRIAEPVSLANVPATLLRAAGLRSLLPGGTVRFDLLDLPRELPEPYVEHRGAAEWVGVLRGERFKYGCRIAPERALSGDERLIDLVANPSETPGGGRSPEAEAASAALRATLDALLGSWRLPPAEMERAVLTQDELDGVRKLGYGG